MSLNKTINFKSVNEMEWKTYLYWFDTFKEQAKLDKIMYLNTSPEECLNRIKSRNREEEKDMKQDYLLSCHEKHVIWLSNKSENEIILIEGNKSKEDIKFQIKNRAQKSM